MVLGFISLLLTFGQNYISKMCIPEKYSRTMLPCLPHDQREGGGGHATDEAVHGPPAASHEEGEAHEGEHHRRLLSYERRFLSADSPGPGCKEVIKSPQSIFKLNFLDFHLINSYNFLS